MIQAPQDTSPPPAHNFWTSASSVATVPLPHFSAGLSEFSWIMSSMRPTTALGSMFGSSNLAHHDDQGKVRWRVVGS